MESNNFLRTEKPPTIRKIDLSSKAISFKTKLEENYKELTQLEKILNIPITRKIETEIQIRGNQDDNSYLSEKINQFERLVEEIDSKKSKLKTKLEKELEKYSPKLSDNTLELTIPINKEITKAEEYLETIKEIKSLIDKFYDKTNFITFYLDFRKTETFKFAWEKELLKSLRILCMAYGKDKLQFNLDKYSASQENRLKKAAQKIISRNISKEQKPIREELKLETVKKHVIEGFDLRPWPMIEHNLVGIEEYDKNLKMYIRKGFKRVKHIIKK